MVWYHITLLKQWLVKYKFRNWKQTNTRRIPVTRRMRETRAEEIAQKLNSTDVWHTHARGISMHVLRRDLKLEIDDFGSDQELDRAIKTYYRLLADYMMRRNHHAVLHGKQGYVPVITGV